MNDYVYYGLKQICNDMTEMDKHIAIKTLDEVFDKDLEYLASMHRKLMMLSLTQSEYNEIVDHLDYLVAVLLSDKFHTERSLRKTIVR